MVLKPRPAYVRPPSQESKRSLPLKIGQTGKSPERLLKVGRKLEQQKSSRSTSRHFRSNSQSPQRCTYSSPNPRHNSPTSTPIVACFSQDVHWDPYGMASAITDRSNIKVPPYRDNPYVKSKAPSNSNYVGCKKNFSPVKYHTPVRDDPTQTKSRNIAEFVDRTTMTMAHSSVGSGSRRSISASRYSDHFLSPSRLAIEKKCKFIHYSGCDCPKHPLYRTSSYLDPAETRPSFYKCYLSPSYLRSQQNSDTSISSNQVTMQNLCESPRQHSENKKVLYNEGIFEYQPYRPKCRMLKTPPPTPMRCGGRTREREKINIPFSHISNSRYHFSCRKTSSRMFTDFQPATYQCPPMQSRGIALPKKVLQSELDIDEYLSTAPVKFLANNEPNGRTTCPHKFYGEL